MRRYLNHERSFAPKLVPEWCSNGAARGARTPDPVITNDVLYQLSYCGEPDKAGPNQQDNARAPDIGEAANWQAAPVCKA